MAGHKGDHRGQWLLSASAKTGLNRQWQNPKHMSNLIHKHLLSSGLISILLEAIKAVKQKDENCIHIQRDLNLTHSQFCNFQKLRYWGLLAHYKENGERVKGKWVITKRGGEFLRAKKSVPHKVYTQNNTVIQKSEEQRMISDYYPHQDISWFQTNFYSERITNQQSLI